MPITIINLMIPMLGIGIILFDFFKKYPTTTFLGVRVENITLIAAIILTIAIPSFGMSDIVPIHISIVIGSIIVVILFLIYAKVFVKIRTWARVGILVSAVGTTLNIITAIANGFKRPVKVPFGADRLMEEVLKSPLHTLMNDETKLKFLGDTVYTGIAVFSIGDFVFGIGTLMIIIFSESLFELKK